MPDPASAASIFALGTHACTTAEIAKPKTSAHQTSHAIRKASLKPIEMVFHALAIVRT
jgi:hypothetical protein